MAIRLEVVRCKKSLPITWDITEWLKKNGFESRESINLTKDASSLLDYINKVDFPKKAEFAKMVNDMITDNSKAKYGSYELILKLK